ncbi:protein ANTAGONIST OF LIKE HETEROCHROMATIN PROTEIN 1-like [Neltuma alba]|uniref:protein ANTAGONIST OF LIKE HETEROCHROMATIN PROTEIN 1-like n=1 Tax=Neltuma alba TaxID=207710 RepID=UPI0010A394D0|nr:protein ANTAGONIST OF LIKE HETEROCHROMATIN PROTEIN 1-like [Prosopis alba]
MESRKLAALLSSLISQLLLLILLLFPSFSSAPSSSSDSNPPFNAFPLVQYFLLSQEIAASLSFSKNRKRKRVDPESDPIDEHPPGGIGIGDVVRSPDSFRSCFRMTASTFEWLSGLLDPLLECRDPVELFPLNLSSGVRLGIGLFRLANGSDYAEISSRFGVSVSVARFCVKQLCRVLCTNFRFWIAFPNSHEIETVSRGFEDISGLPNCCGVIDCARFNVVSSETSCEDKIAAQIVVDSSSRILSIIAGFRGHKSNSRIIRSSTFYRDIEEGKLLNSPAIDIDGVAINQYLIGDSSFPFLPWLMIPFAESLPGSYEENFNSAHKLMRISALRTIDSLKNWGILSRPIKEELKMAVAYIGACSILHNSLLMREDFSALSGGQDYQFQNLSIKDSRSEENSNTMNAWIVRSALATRAKKSNGSST